MFNPNNPKYVKRYCVSHWSWILYRIFHIFGYTLKFKWRLIKFESLSEIQQIMELIG
jgi:hypothetical protein